MDNLSMFSAPNSSSSSSDSENEMPGAFPDREGNRSTRRCSFPPPRSIVNRPPAASLLFDTVHRIGFLPTFQEFARAPLAVGTSHQDTIPEEPEPTARHRFCGICNERIDLYDEPLKVQAIRLERENRKRSETTHKNRSRRWSSLNLVEYMDTMRPYRSELPPKKNAIGTSLCQSSTMLHTFCLECSVKYIQTNLEKGFEGNHVLPIRCPSCPWYREAEASIITHDIAEKILGPKDLAEWYFRHLIECSEYFYCPNPRCSMPLELPEDSSLVKSCCGSCKEVLCIKCKSLDHPGKSCKQFQKSRRLDPNVRAEKNVKHLARRLGWKKCPKCHHIVERSSGCDHMTCKCKYEFCYRCGSDWDFGCSQRFCRLFRSGDFIYEAASIALVPFDHVMDGIDTARNRIRTTFRRMRRAV